jgi:predicted MPP superfamily phosphohydrolase
MAVLSSRPEAQQRLLLPRINRRKFIGLAGAAAVAALGTDSVLIEPMRPRLERQEIFLRRWPSRLDGFTIALLSDFHYDPVFSMHPIRSAVEMVNKLGPDLVALAGDFITSPMFGKSASGAAAAEPCAQLLQPLRAPHGVWAVLGNHDEDADPPRVINALGAVEIRVLRNEAIPIERDGDRSWLAGIKDVLVKRGADLPSTLRPIPSGEPVVLLAHEPDYADYVARYPVDLQLSGHSHGGQIRLPSIRPLYLPPLARKYYQGMYKVRNLTLYTSRGLGTIRLPIRLNCAPEVTLITLRRGAQA